MNARQARLSLVMGVVAALGTAAIVWAWWDSTEYYLLWASRNGVIQSVASQIVLLLGGDYHDVQMGFSRGRRLHCGTHLSELFPYIEIDSGIVQLPMWFLLCVFISVLLLLWLVLMKRLARPRITEGSSHGAGG
jgi:hypothetical protein